MDRKRRLLFGNNVGRGAAGAAAASFSATLLSTLVPQVYTGSSTPTFTRATTAYVTDFEGLLKQVPSGCARFTGSRFVQNAILTTTLIPASTGSGWTLSATTGTTGIADPAGGTNATTLTATSAASATYCSTVAKLPLGRTGVNSVYVRRRTGTGSVFLYGSNDDNPGRVNIGAALTSSWQRFSASPQIAASSSFWQIDMTTSGDAVDVYLPMAEDVTGQSNQNPSEGISVGVLSAPYHGAGVDGCKYFATQNGNTVASNVVTEATGAAISSATLLGYQAEGARTNLCLQSQTFGTTWTPQLVAVTSNTTVAPDGTTTADTLTTTGTNNIASVYQGGVVANTTTQAFSCYVKAGTCSYPYLLIQGSVAQNFVCKVFDLTGGTLGETKLGTNTGTLTSASITSVGGGWYRIEMVGQITDATRYFIVGLASAATGNTFSTAGDITVPGTPNSTLRVWGAQAETASFASSYIPTTTVAVARNADALSYSSASNISWTVGSIVLDAYVPVFNSSTNPRLFESGGGDAIVYTTGVTTCHSYDGTNAASVNAGGSVATAVRKYGVTWGTGLKCFREGSAGTGTAFVGTFAAGATMLHLPSGAWFGNVRNMAIYTSEKTAAEMQALTT